MQGVESMIKYTWDFFSVTMSIDDTTLDEPGICTELYDFRNDAYYEYFQDVPLSKNQVVRRSIEDVDKKRFLAYGIDSMQS